jgi:hypothetical protein
MYLRFQAFQIIFFSQQKIALENRNSKQTKLLTSEKFNDYFFLARFILYLTKVVSIFVVKRQMVKPLIVIQIVCWVLLIYLAEMVPTQIF